jgi:hypothetical protein
LREASERGQWPSQVPLWSESSQCIGFLGEGQASGQLQNELWGSLVSRQGCSLIPRSSLRPLSGRLTHHSEGLPSSLLFAALCPANCGSRRDPRVPRNRVDASQWTTAGRLASIGGQTLQTSRHKSGGYGRLGGRLSQAKGRRSSVEWNASAVPRNRRKAP